MNKQAARQTDNHHKKGTLEQLQVMTAITIVKHNKSVSNQPKRKRCPKTLCRLLRTCSFKMTGRALNSGFLPMLLTAIT